MPTTKDEILKLINGMGKEEINGLLWSRGDIEHEMHSGQLEMWKFIDNAEYIKIVIHCGRGYGKTWGLLGYAIRYAIKNPGSRIVIATQTRESAKQILIPTLQLMTSNIPSKYKPKWRSQGHCIDVGNESTIVAEGADDDNGDKLRGPYAHLIVCDEFGFWRNPKYVVNDILLPQAQRVNGKLVITTTTPKTLGHEFYYFRNECKNKNTYMMKTVYDNPRLTSQQTEKYAEECGGLDSISFRREYLCEDVVDTNFAVIPEFKKDIHVVNEIEIPKYRDFYVGMDLGFKDFTFVVFCFYDFFNARIVVMDELCLSAELTSNIAIKIKEKESELFKGFEPLLRVSDNDIQQLYDLNVNFGLKFVPATKYDKEESINRLRGVFGDNKIIIHKRCINLIDQLLLGVYNNSRKDYERTPGLGHLDGIDALRYLIRKINYNKNPVPEHSGLSAYNNPIPFKKNKQKTAFMEILNGTK